MLGLLIPLDRQWIIGGYNVPPFCGITGVLDDYYGMAVSHKSQNHNPLTYHNDSWDTARKSQQDHASNLGAEIQRFFNEFRCLFLNTSVVISSKKYWFPL